MCPYNMGQNRGSREYEIALVGVSCRRLVCRFHHEFVGRRNHALLQCTADSVIPMLDFSKTAYLTRHLETGTLAGCLRTLARRGFQGASLKMDELLALEEADRPLLAEALIETRLRLLIHGRCESDDAAMHRQLGAVLRLHRETNAVQNFTLDAAMRPVNAQKVFDNGVSLTAIRRILGPCLDAGISVAIENSPTGPFGEHLETMARMLHPLTIALLLDTGHLLLAENAGLLGGNTLATAVLRMPVPIAEVHLSDNHGHSDDHLPLGMGIANVPALVVALARLPETPWLTVESRPPGLPAVGQDTVVLNAALTVLDSLRKNVGHTP